MTSSHQQAVDQLLLSLKAKSEDVRQAAGQNLQSFVEQTYREMSGDPEGLRKLLNDVSRRVCELVSSSDSNEKLGGLLAMDILIDLDTDETNATKITRFANQLGHVFPSSNDTQVISRAAEVLGHLARRGGSLTTTADVVEFEVKRSLEWLQGGDGRGEARRHAAVLVLKELATNAPTLFYTHVSDFFDHMWKALRDPKVRIREGAVQALRACLELTAPRESRGRIRWYHKIFAEAQVGFKMNNADSIHGSLLTIGELLRNSGEFMLARFKEVCETILRYRDHRNQLVRRTVISLIPRLAYFCVDPFVRGYLDACLSHLLSVLRSGSERPTAFIALGEMAMAVSEHITPHLPTIVPLLREGLNPKEKRKYCAESVKCVSMLAQAVGPALTEHMKILLDQMFAATLSADLTAALADICQYVNTLDAQIQDRLLNSLSHILANAPYRPPGSPMVPRSSAATPHDGPADNALITLALTTLATFNFNKHTLTDFVRQTVVNYLDHDTPAIRKAAALTCTKLLIGNSDAAPTRGRLAITVGEVLDKLLIVGIADPDPSIRQAVLASLDSRFDHHLAQAENLRSLFIALNDEVFEIRVVAIESIGRLTAINPAYVMPSLRKTLIQLLTELEFSGDGRNKEESARLLGYLIRSCKRLIKPYVAPIFRALLPKLEDSIPAVATSVLATLGDLSLVGGEEMMVFVDELLPIIIATLQDQSGTSKREIALRTLGQLVESTGYVVHPYLKYPNLLSNLLNILKAEPVSWEIRREVIKVLGILGALDPYRYKMHQMEAGEHSTDIPQGVSGDGKDVSNSSATATDWLPGMGPSSEEYYPTVAISALMRILRDQSLHSHHHMVIQAVMFIFKSLGMKGVPFLPEIIPAFMHVLDRCEGSGMGAAGGLADFLFQQLGRLVAIVRQHIRNYLGEVFERIKKFWREASILPQIVELVMQISLALNDEFKAYLPDLIPEFLRLLQGADPDPLKSTVLKRKALEALEVFGTNLDDYLYLIIPAMVKLFEAPNTPREVRAESIRTLGRLCHKLNFSDYASRIVHPLARVLATNSELRDDTMDTLCALVFQLGSDYAIFVPMVNKVLARQRIQHSPYEALVTRLLKNQPLSDVGLPVAVGGPSIRNEESIVEGTVKKHQVNQTKLQSSWEASQRSTREDWVEWMRRFSVELLKESPSPALRSCSALAQIYHPLARELFNAAFVSCWSELDEANQDELVHHLETAFSSPMIPHDILQMLLNLAEFMEHDEKPLPIDHRTLAALAEKCHAYAKALHYKEIEFQTSPSTTIEALISINNQLQQPEAAVGILDYAQENHSIELKESWYEKLRRWEDALEAYESKQAEDPFQVELTLGRTRCLHALARWEQLAQLSADTWDNADDSTRSAIAPLAAAASWNLGRWRHMEMYVDAIDEGTLDGTFFRAVILIHKNQYKEGLECIDRTRQLLDTKLTALVGESYNRAYSVVVTVQQLAELEEVVQYKEAGGAPGGDLRRDTIYKMWKERLAGCRHAVHVWQRIMAVRSIVLSPQEDMGTWLKFVTLCRKSDRLPLAHQTLVTILGQDPSPEDDSPLVNVDPRANFAYMKYLWSAGHRVSAFNQLRAFVGAVEVDKRLAARCALKLGEWQKSLQNSLSDPESVAQVLESFENATHYDSEWYKAWHAWALMNSEMVSHLGAQGASASEIEQHLVPAIDGYFRSIALGSQNQHSGHALQDTLRLLTLWFKHGAQQEVEAALVEGFNSVSINTWLSVIPQIIARIHSPSPPVRRLIHQLLTNVAKEHPQALIYPLTVASKSQAPERREAALALMDKMRQHSPTLVDQALLVSQELIRVAILWHEMWHEGLEEASRLYFGEHDAEGMFETLAPLHAMMEKGPETLRETSFQQAFGRDLQEALDWSRKYQKTQKVSELNQAWDLYYHVFRRINKQLPQLTTLELQYVSPELLAATALDLAMPGTYRAGEEVIHIAGFKPTLSVITSKQRPRKLTIFGSDGAEFVFLLKGHEDLRQDERVMQLFGLVNNLLANDRETSKRDLSIRRYAVIPLAPNSGLIGWVPNTDTLHALIREYRESRKILLNIEHRLMLQMAPDYDNLTLMQKVEVFEYALDNTTGQDLYKVLWLKSRNSEVWLDKRTNYTRSLAVMSMVGYILGLGDRHPSNLMLDRLTGKILHIDFGDCFEVAMARDKFPEKIPFRLTRMLTKAMEVSGIEGNFRSTCEGVMRVCREHKDSLMAMLEAFVHDPLINWRLMNMQKDRKKGEGDEGEVPESGSRRPSQALMSTSGPMPSLEAARVNAGIDEPSENLNKRALEVISRISDKLRGTDFGNAGQPLDTRSQVDRLILQATSHENLCQCYIGWCPFW